MTGDDVPPVVVFDATNDVVTCRRHHLIHPMDQPCPACQLNWALQVERYTLTPAAANRLRLMRALNAAEAHQRRTKGRL